MHDDLFRGCFFFVCALFLCGIALLLGRCSLDLSGCLFMGLGWWKLS